MAGRLAALNEILKDEAVRAKLDKQGLVPRGGGPSNLSPPHRQGSRPLGGRGPARQHHPRIGRA